MKKIHIISALCLIFTFVTFSANAENTYKDNKLTPTDNQSENVLTYTVKSGDSLSRISKKHYGTYTNWNVIADANNINSPYTLTVGQTLVIPGEKVYTSKTVSKEVVGKITKFDSKKRMIEVEDESGNKQMFELNEKVRVKYSEDGKALSVEAAN